MDVKEEGQNNSVKLIEIEKEGSLQSLNQLKIGEPEDKNSIDQDINYDDKNTLKESSKKESTSISSFDDMYPSEKKPIDENSSEEPKLDKDSIEENHFDNLFMEACSIYKKTFPIETNSISMAQRNIKASFRSFSFNSLNFNSTEYLFAYFERYSKLNAAISRHRFSNAIKNCEKLKTCVKKSELNVISLGGGPGTDMVGFCSAFQEFREDSIPVMNFCVVDQWEKWESFNDIVRLLLREKDYGNASKVFQKSEICTSFMKVDLMDENPPQKYKSSLSSADIVLLSRVLDSLNFQKDRPEFMLHNIARRMKKDALLLLVDCRAKYYENHLLEKIYVSDLKTFLISDLDFDLANQSHAEIAVFVKTV